MNAFCLGVLVAALAATPLSAQEALPEQALRHLREQPAAPEVLAPPERDPRTAPISSAALERLQGSSSDGIAASVASEVPAAVFGGLALPFGLFVTGVVIVATLWVMRGRALNYGLRYTRALTLGGFAAAVWLWLVSLAGWPESATGAVIAVLIIPNALLWSAPLLLAGKEELSEVPFFRRWFSFERGGSARWAGPRSYRRHHFTAFDRHPDPVKGFTSG